MGKLDNRIAGRKPETQRGMKQQQENKKTKHKLTCLREGKTWGEEEGARTRLMVEHGRNNTSTIAIGQGNQQ